MTNLSPPNIIMHIYLVNLCRGKHKIYSVITIKQINTESIPSLSTSQNVCHDANLWTIKYHKKVKTSRKINIKFTVNTI